MALDPLYDNVRLVQQSGQEIISLGAPSASNINLNLDSPYIFGTSGDCYGQVFQALDTGEITDVWFSPLAYTNFAATDQTVRVEFRTIVASTQFTPGALLANGTFDVSLASAPTGLTRFSIPSGSRPTLNAGDFYCVCIGDPDGTATNYVQVRQTLRETGGLLSNTGTQTVNGFSTVGTSNGYVSNIVVKQNGRIYAGSVLDTAIASTSNTRMRGWWIRPPYDLYLFRVLSLAAWEHRVYESTELPLTGVILASLPAGTLINSNFGRMWNTPVLLRKNVTYYCVWNPGASNSTNGYQTVTGGVTKWDAELIQTFPFNGRAGWVEQTTNAATNSWTAYNDRTCAGYGLSFLPAGSVETQYAG